MTPRDSTAGHPPIMFLLRNRIEIDRSPIKPPNCYHQTWVAPSPGGLGSRPIAQPFLAARSSPAGELYWRVLRKHRRRSRPSRVSAAQPTTPSALRCHAANTGTHQEAGRGLPPGATPRRARQGRLREADTTTKPHCISQGIILRQMGPARRAENGDLRRKQYVIDFDDKTDD